SYHRSGTPRESRRDPSLDASEDNDRFVAVRRRRRADVDEPGRRVGPIVAVGYIIQWSPQRQTTEGATMPGTGTYTTKHIFVTGGVVSSLGKGLTCASVGMLLERRGLRVRLQKFDPYLNVDPGTMSPYQHGEVYVLDDGAETDLDLGHYERFTNAPLSRD